MKYCFIFLLSINILKAQVSFFPEMPKLGDVVTISYDATKTNLANYSSIKAEILYFDNKIGFNSVTNPLILKKGEKVWEGIFQNKESNSVGVLIIFKDSTGKIIDTNKGKGYSQLIYDSNNKLINGARTGLALALDVMARFPTLKFYQDRDFQIKLYEQDFIENPKLKNLYLFQYLTSVATLKNNGYKEIINKEIESRIPNLNDATPSDLACVISLYRQIGDYKKADIYAKQLKKKEPKGVSMEIEIFQQFMSESDFSKKIALYKSFNKDFPYSATQPIMVQTIAWHYLSQNNLIALKELMADYEKKKMTLGFVVYGNLAMKLVESKKELNIAEQYIIKAIKSLETEKVTVPNFNQADYLKRYKYTHGIILENKGDLPNAYKFYKEALSTNIKESNSEVNERYVLAAIKMGDIDEARKGGELFVKFGKATDRIKSALKDIYIKNGSDGLDAYLNSLDAEISKSSKVQLANNLISEVAPQLNIRDLKGELVSLESFKGKIVVLDFWATWCGPCIKSFPGMKLAKQKYEKNPDIIFLFIDTMEKIENPKSVVAKFIERNNYNDFTVLMDIEGVVASQYKVESIPAKFVIDKAGNIRFRVVGAENDTNAVLDEISTMIEILIEQNK